MYGQHTMNINKNSLNKRLSQALGNQYQIEKLSKMVATEKGIEPGYHVVYTPENRDPSGRVFQHQPW